MSKPALRGALSRVSSPPAATPAIEVADLHFAYPDGTEVLTGVSFSVAEGESVAVIGPNGAGKSTLLLHLNGILAGQGSVRVFGVPVTKNSLREIRQRVGVVFQDPEDQLFLPSVAQDVAFGPFNLGLDTAEVAERVRDALAAVGMEGFEDHSAHLLSFGQKKRIATATVLAMRPDVLVLDEPSANLDPKARRQLITILEGLPVTKIVVTHDLPVAYELCERALILAQGHIVADGPIEEILSDTRLLKANDLELPYAFSLPRWRTGSSVNG
jgi:cobalt/nickel transport system ATP-binding protein